MDHLTDEQIGHHFMGGPETEKEFTDSITHMHQCKVCRERAWQWLQVKRNEAKAVMNEMAKAMAEAFSGKTPDSLLEMLKGGGGLHGLKAMFDKGPSEEDLAEGIAGMVRMAVDRLMKNTKQAEWDSEDLFDTERLDDLPHLARCSKCRRLFEMVALTVDRALDQAKKQGHSETISAVCRLQSWMKVTRTRIQESMDQAGVQANPKEPSGPGDEIRSFCG